MSEAADIVRRAAARLNDRDLDGFVDLCSKRIIFHDVPEIPGSRLYQGPDEVREWAAGLSDVSEDYEFALWEIEENGDALMAETSVDMTGASSGVELGWRFWTIWRVKEGKITYHHGYSVREDALADFRGDQAADSQSEGRSP
jgi:ketosteroid isomerase-like protein